MRDEKLLTIARQAIQAKLDDQALDLYVEDDDLKAKGAVFVTLTQNEQLRGCIGSLVAYRPFIEDLIGNAQAAAFEDPRFMPLRREELAQTQIEISILSEPKAVHYKDWEELRQKITPFEDGIILRLGHYQATFLPQVWEQLPRFEDFFGHLGEKAGIQGDIFALHPDIEIYQVKKIKEQ